MSTNSASRRRLKPNADSGLRNPSDPKRVIRNKDVSADELFDVARLVVAAEIAKIHTIEWTPQLLYDEPLYKGMNANWNGLLGTGDPDDSKALADDRDPWLRQVEERDQGVAVVFGVRVGAGHFRAGQQGPALRHHESRTTSMAASTISARRSTSRKSSSRCTGCIRWCPT